MKGAAAGTANPFVTVQQRAGEASQPAEEPSLPTIISTGKPAEKSADERGDLNGDILQIPIKPVRTTTELDGVEVPEFQTEAEGRTAPDSGQKEKAGRLQRVRIAAYRVSDASGPANRAEGSGAS